MKCKNFLLPIIAFAFITAAFGQGTYRSLRIVTLIPYSANLDTIRLASDDSLSLGAEAQRLDDTTQWEIVTAICVWSSDSSLHLGAVPITGSGWIYARFNDAGNVLSDSVWVIVTQSPPDSIALFSNVGDPSVVPCFPAIDTVAAGSTDSIFAKIFDRNGRWLNHFENIDSSRNVIFWTIARQSGPVGGGSDLLSATAGFKTYFSPHIAYTLYRATATFTSGNTILTASTLIYVKPGPAQHLVIEATPTIIGPLLLGDHPLGSLDFSATDATRNAFAILRDSYGNFIDYSKNTLWTSSDTTVFFAINGNTSIGEGIAVRRTDYGQAYMIAMDTTTSPGDTLRDTVLVLISNDYYTSLRIYTVNPYIPNVDTVWITTDDSLILRTEAQRSGGQWEDVSVSWYKSASLPTATNPPASPAFQWTVHPISAGSGWIWARRSGAVSDSVWVIFTQPPSIRGNQIYRTHPDVWSIFSDNSGVRIHIPERGSHAVKIYSLSGTVVHSQTTGEKNLSIRLPKGVFIVSVNGMGSGPRIIRKVVTDR